MSFTELRIKKGLGRVDFLNEILELCVPNGLTVLPLTAEHGLDVASLPLLHRDPFDRLLIAQATVEGLVVLTDDDRFPAYGLVTRRYSD